MASDVQAAMPGLDSHYGNKVTGSSELDAAKARIKQLEDAIRTFRDAETRNFKADFTSDERDAYVNYRNCRLALYALLTPEAQKEEQP